MGRFHGHDLLKGFGMNAAPGWIEDDEIRLIGKVTQFYKDITGDEAAVIEIIGPGIGLGCRDGFFNYFYAYHFVGKRADDLGNGAGTAVQIQHQARHRPSKISYYGV